MPSNEIVVINERQVPPKVGHENALIWSCFRPAAASNVSPPEAACLHRMTGFVQHGLQGRKNTDHHSHANIEQVYYILDGRTEVLIGEEKYPVQPDDVVYLPPTIPHQNINESSDDWVFLLILSCLLKLKTMKKIGFALKM